MTLVGLHKRDGSWYRVALAAFFVGFGGLSNLGRRWPAIAALEQFVWIACGLSVVLLIVRGSVSFSVLLRNLGVPWIAYVALSAVSVMWSIAPGVTLAETIRLGGTIAIGGVLGAWMAPPILVRTLLRSGALVVAISLGLYWSGTGWAKDTDGSILGLVTHRNSIGAIAGLGFVVTLVTWRWRRQRADLGLVALFSISLAVSDSRTSQIGAVVTVMLVGAVVAFRRDRGLGFAVASTALSSCIVGFTTTNGLGWGAERLGKDVTFTGRTMLWEAVIEQIRVHPLLGLGYGAAWTDNSPLLALTGEHFRTIRSSHNIWLETQLALGWVGLVVLIAMFGAYLLRLKDGAQLAARAPMVAGATLVFTLIRSLGESGFPAKNSSFVIFAVAIFCVAGGSRRTGDSDPGEDDTVAEVAPGGRSSRELAGP